MLKGLHDVPAAKAKSEPSVWFVKAPPVGDKNQVAPVGSQQGSYRCAKVMKVLATDPKQRHVLKQLFHDEKLDMQREYIPW